MKMLYLPALQIFLLLTLSCENESDYQQSKLLSISPCKNFLTPSLKAEIPDSLSCIEYSFSHQKHKLTIKHINAGFNCCIDTLYCDADIVADTIFVHEIEEFPLCKCNCLYDMQFEIYNVEKKEYILKIEEPYVGNMKKLLFELDLTTSFSGSFYVTRLNYPWNISN